MKLITAIIRPDRLDAVKTALFEIEVTGLTHSRVAGHGGEKTHLETYRGQPVVYEFVEKIQLEIAVSETFVDRTIEAIVRSARTGEVGDGKIFVQPLDRVVRIRTGESDNEALTPLALTAAKSLG
jgi:nitrogen regulatory protein P-II 1